ncbi:MAG: ribosome maturation factor RimM [Prochlorococcaceae cyanobacterium]|jgi:16S rRNA processing protein RimM
MADSFLVVGEVVAAQGLRGELRVLPSTDFPSRLTEAGPRWLRPRGDLSTPPRPVQLLQGRPLPGRDLFVLRLQGVDDRSQAEALVRHELLVAADDRPPLQDGEFHVLDLQGLEVRLEPEATAIGHVRDLHHGGNDLLEIELVADGRRCLVPFVEPIVPRIELAEGWLLLTPPVGLLDL